MTSRKRGRAHKPQRRAPAAPPKAHKAVPVSESHPPEDGAPALEKQLAQQILKKNLTNIAEKVKGGRTLTAGEMALAQSVVAGLPTGEAVGRAADATAMAKQLNVSPKTFGRWRQRYPDFPKPNPDWSWNSGAVIDWCRRHGLIGDGKPLEPDLSPRDEMSFRLLVTQVKAAERRERQADGRLIDLELANAFVDDLAGTIRSIVDSMPRALAVRCNPNAPAQAEKVLREWKDQTLLPTITRRLENPNAKPTTG